jgi:hypothetical protein
VVSGDITNASQLWVLLNKQDGLKLKKVIKPLWFVLLMS